MEKFCQSCAIPLTEELLGTEADGSKVNKYCSYCYVGGQFVAPNITYEEMLKMGYDGIDRGNGSKIKKWLIKKSYPLLLKKCERWNNK